jgi:hypothetical protein
VTVAELLSALEAEVTMDGEILLGRLREKADGLDYWPEETFKAARACFGDVVYARTGGTGGRTARALDRRISHALRVWDEKYGPLNAVQEAYADAVLAAAIRKGEAEAGHDRGKRYSFVQNKIGQAVNHEVVDGGFRKRAEKLIDVSAELAGEAA